MQITRRQGIYLIIVIAFIAVVIYVAMLPKEVAQPTPAVAVKQENITTPVPTSTPVPGPTKVLAIYQTLSDIPWDTVYPLTLDQVREGLNFFAGTPNLSAKSRQVAEGYMDAQIRGYIRNSKMEVVLGNGSFNSLMFSSKGEIYSAENVRIALYPKDIRVYAMLPDNPIKREKRTYIFFFHNNRGIAAAAWGDKSLIIPRYATGDSSGDSGGNSGGGNSGGSDFGGPVGDIGA